MPSSNALRPFREVLAWLPFELEDFGAVNSIHDRWRETQSKEDLDVILKWIYAFTYRYVVIRVLRTGALSSVDVDSLHTALFTRSRSVLDNQQQPELFAPYIAALCRNGCNNYMRHTARRRELLRREIAEEDVENNPFGEPLSQDYVTLRTELEQAIRRLPDTLQTIISQRFFEGLSYASIAADTGYTPATLRSLAHRALQKLNGDPRLAGMFKDWYET